MCEQHGTEEVSVICADCGALYPALRLPTGKLTRVSNIPFCRCGCDSFVEVTDG